jgi:hypothetical protein
VAAMFFSSFSAGMTTETLDMRTPKSVSGTLEDN